MLILFIFQFLFETFIFFEFTGHKALYPILLSSTSWAASQTKKKIYPVMGMIATKKINSIIQACFGVNHWTVKCVSMIPTWLVNALLTSAVMRCNVNNHRSPLTTHLDIHLPSYALTQPSTVASIEKKSLFIPPLLLFSFDTGPYNHPRTDIVPL